MLIRSLFCAALLISTLACASDAGEAWTATTERGLPVYSIGTKDAGVRLVCDPDRIFGESSNASVIATFPKDKAPDMIVFLAKTGEQARLPVKDGLALQHDAQVAEWSKMIAIVKAGGPFAVVTSTDSLSFETEAMPDLACE